MDKNTQETLENVIKITKKLLGEKYSKRKRLNYSEIWEQATATRDIEELKRWLEQSQNSNN